MTTPGSEEHPWEATAREYARLVAAQPAPPLDARTPYGVVPAGCRLILVSEDVLDQWSTRTERGERITAEWGEPSPEGWYEPRFTVHADDALAQPAPPLDVERLARAMRRVLVPTLDDGDIQIAAPAIAAEYARLSEPKP